MADHRPYPDLKPHTTPRWVKVFGIIFIIVVLLFVILHLSLGGHGPGSHVPMGDTTPGQHGERQP